MVRRLMVQRTWPDSVASLKVKVLLTLKDLPTLKALPKSEALLKQRLASPSASPSLRAIRDRQATEP
jgi:hypothetical protein